MKLTFYRKKGAIFKHSYGLLVSLKFPFSYVKVIAWELNQVQLLFLLMYQGKAKAGTRMDPLGVKCRTPRKHFPLNSFGVSFQISLNSDVNFLIHNQTKCLAGLVGPASPFTSKPLGFQVSTVS